MLGASPPPPPTLNIQTSVKFGPTRPIPISTQHLCKFFPVWQRWTYDVVARARTCTTLVGLSLNFTKKCEYWIKLACSYTEILTQVTQVLRVGYLNSNDLMINCIQLALEWRVPLMNLLSVKFFAPWLLFITSNIYIYQNSTCFIFSNSIQYAAINCGIFTLPKDCS